MIRILTVDGEVKSVTINSLTRLIRSGIVAGIL
jgi:hypothetical protein